MTVSRILAGNLPTKDVVVGNCEVNQGGLPALLAVVRNRTVLLLFATSHTSHVTDHGHVTVTLRPSAANLGGPVFHLHLYCISYLYFWVIRYRDVSFRVSIE